MMAHFYINHGKEHFWQTPAFLSPKVVSYSSGMLQFNVLLPSESTWVSALASRHLRLIPSSSCLIIFFFSVLVQSCETEI
jgi:hypothetical protein